MPGVVGFLASGVLQLLSPVSEEDKVVMAVLQREGEVVIR